MLKLIKRANTTGKSAIVEIDEDGKEIVVTAGLTEEEAQKQLDDLDDEGGAIYAKD